jgi:hypothetical protein
MNKSIKILIAVKKYALNIRICMFFFKKHHNTHSIAEKIHNNNYSTTY